MKFDDILILLIGTAEANVKPSELIEACKKFNMRQIEYFNINDDHLFDNGYNFIFETESSEEARLEIIEIDDNILQSGFQIIYKPRMFFKKIDRDFTFLYNLLQESYVGEVPQHYQGIELYNFFNEISQSYLSKSVVNGQDVINFRVTNKETWMKFKNVF